MENDNPPLPQGHIYLRTWTTLSADACCKEHYKCTSNVMDVSETCAGSATTQTTGQNVSMCRTFLSHSVHNSKVEIKEGQWELFGIQDGQKSVEIWDHVGETTKSRKRRLLLDSLFSTKLLTSLAEHWPHLLLMKLFHSLANHLSHVVNPEVINSISTVIGLCGRVSMNVRCGVFRFYLDFSGYFIWQRCLWPNWVNDCCRCIRERGFCIEMHLQVQQYRWLNRTRTEESSPLSWKVKIRTLPESEPPRKSSPVVPCTASSFIVPRLHFRNVNIWARSHWDSSWISAWNDGMIFRSFG